MKPLRSILTAGLVLAALSTGVRAETFPIFEDAAGSATANTIAKAAGTAKTLAVSAKSNAFINFGVGSAGIDPATVTQARLVIFVPKSSVVGTLSIKNLTSGFTETIATKTIPAPTIGATLDTINLAQIPLKGDFFISDITAQMKAWLGAPNTEFGIAITSDGVATATLASKEGAGSGHPAFIEVDVNRPGGVVSGTSANFSGPLGIGTNSPATPLHIVGVTTLQAPTATSGTALSLTSNTGVQRGDLAVAASTGSFSTDAVANDVVLRSFNGNKLLLQSGSGASAIAVLGDGNVGVGTTAPDVKLDVKGSIRGVGDIVVKAETATSSAAFSLTSNTGIQRGDLAAAASAGDFSADAVANDVVLRSFNGNKLLLQSGPDASAVAILGNGKVGFGTAIPDAQLQVNHTPTGAGFDSVFKLFRKDTSNPILEVRTIADGQPFNLELFEGQAFKPGGGAWGAVSDRRLKKDIENLRGALEHLLQLRSVTYEYIDPVKSHQLPGTQIGFIAQEVEAVFPEWVMENAEGYKTVTIRGFESLAVQAIRELRQEKNTEIAALTAKVAALEARDREREARLARLETALDERPARIVRASLDVK